MADDWEHFINTVSDAEDRGLQPVMSKVYEKELRKRLVGEQLLTPHTELVGKPGATTRIPFRLKDNTTPGAAVAADWVYPLPSAYGETSSESIVEVGVESVWPQIPSPDPAMSWNYEDVTPTKFGHKDIVTSDLIETANWDVIADKQDILVKGMAEFRDARIWNALLEATTVTGEAHAAVGADAEIQFDTFNSGEAAYDEDATGLLSVVVTQTTAPAVPYTIDYVQGWILFDGDPGDVTLDYIYTTRQVVAAFTDGAFGYDEISRCNTIVSTHNTEADTVVVDPYGMEQILRDDRFLDRDLLKTDVLLTGQIAKVAGDDVLMTQMLYTNVAVVLKRQMIGYQVWKRKMQAKKEDIAYTDGDVWLATYEKSIPFISRPELIVVILNGQSDAYTYVAP